MWKLATAFTYIHYVYHKKHDYLNSIVNAVYEVYKYFSNTSVL